MDINQLEEYFNNTTLPKAPVKLNQCETITDINLFVKSHIATCKHSEGSKAYLPSYLRLVQFKGIIVQQTVANFS